MSWQWLNMILSHPVSPFAFSFSQCVLVLGFTSRDSLVRILGFAPMLGYVQLALRTTLLKEITIRQLYRSILMGATASMAMQYLDSVLLSRWTYEAHGPTSALGGQTKLRTPTNGILRSSTFLDRLVFGWEETFRARSSRTPWEVRHVPKFFPDNPNLVPKKADFLRWSVLRCFLSLFVVDVAGYMGRDATMNSVNFAPGRIPLFNRIQDVTREELLLRLISSVLHWVMFVCLLQAIYDAAAIVIVVLNLGRIERWPPLFNRWTECWSVRRFWGSFWHQGTRQKFLAPANFLSFSVLRFPRGTLLARYNVLILTFVISGAFHQLGDVASGVPWREAGAVKFFVMQALGIIVEDTVQGIFRWVNSRERTAAEATGWKAALGSFWLLMWLTWTTPAWVYPVARCSSGEAILPFSLLRWMMD